jgi:phenylalanyl-tRNA synthetase alpha chain
VGAESAKIGQGTAFRNKWIKKDGDGLVLVEKEVRDAAREQLQKIRDTRTAEPKTVTDLRKRKLVTTGRVFNYAVRKGAEYSREMRVQETDLTADMLASGAWKEADFKPYNFRALGADQGTGALHPLYKVREEFRTIFFNQGFVEMPTNRCVSGQGLRGGGGD